MRIFLIPLSMTIFESENFRFPFSTENSLGTEIRKIELKARLHDRKNWNGSDKKTNGSDKI